MADREAQDQHEPNSGATPARRSERSAWQTTRMVAQAVQVRLRFLVVLIVAFVVVGQWDLLRNYWDRYTRASVAPLNGMQPVSTDTEYFCPMDPGVVSNWPGKCSICNMALVRRKKGDAAPLPNGVVARMQLLPYRVQLAGIQSSPVTYRPLERVVETVGRVVADPTRVHAIRAPRSAVVAEVTAGSAWEPVPEGAILLTLRADAHGDGRSAAAEPVKSPISGRLLGVKVRVGDNVQAGTLLAEVADVEAISVDAELFEKELPLVAPGLRAELTTESRSGRDPLWGRVRSVRPAGPDETGSFRARIELDPTAETFWPGMRAVVRIEVPVSQLEPFRSMPSDPPPLGQGELRALYVCPDHPDVVREAPGRCPQDRLELERQPLGDLERVGWWCPMHPSVSADRPGQQCRQCSGMALVPRVISYSPAGQVLAVPESAVIDTGSRTLVFVDRGQGMFDGVEVVLGPRCGDHFPVVRGLQVGEHVATTGGFLLDAETRLNPSLAAGYFGARSGGPNPPRPGQVTTPNSDPAPVESLSPADRALIAQQRVCPVTGKPLGSMGTPVRVSVAGSDVFLCCDGCEAALKKNPEKYLSRLKKP